jgi:hypothetical protein
MTKLANRVLVLAQLDRAKEDLSAEVIFQKKGLSVTNQK